MPVVNYLWNPLNNNIVREFDDAGTVIAGYTTEANQFGNVVSQRRNGVDSVYHYDGQGSTLALTDANGNATDVYAYTAIGEVTDRSGTTVNPFQYIGQKGYYRDAETGEYEVRRRPLPAQRGRWLSTDTLRHLREMNLYGYVGNRPTLSIDPSGEFVAVKPPLSPGSFPYDIGYDSFCEECGKVDHTWDYISRKPKAIYDANSWGTILIQKVCVDSFVEYCEPSCDGKQCAPVRVEQGACCFIELIGSPFIGLTQRGIAPDQWTAFEPQATIQQAPCQSWGFQKNSAVVRAFIDWDDIKEIAWEPAGPIKCGDFEIEVGKHIRADKGDPGWWTKKTNWSHEINILLNMLYDCCPARGLEAGQYTFVVGNEQVGPMPCDGIRRKTTLKK